LSVRGQCKCWRGHVCFPPCLGKPNIALSSFFFGAIGASVGVLCLEGVLTGMQVLAKVVLPSSSSSLQSLVVMMVVMIIANQSLLGTKHSNPPAKKNLNHGLFGGRTGPLLLTRSVFCSIQPRNLLSALFDFGPRNQMFAVCRERIV
jgi:hypothetical protein